MSKVTIKNPTDKDLNLNYQGEDFFIPAEKSEAFEPDVAAHWLQIYGFVEVVEAKAEKKVEKEEKKSKAK